MKEAASLIKSKSLTAQIRDAERQVLHRQRQVDLRAATMVRKIRQQMTAPATLLLAGGFGFILGELSKCRPQQFRGTAVNPQAAGISPLRVALNLLTSARTLYTALPLAWMMKSRCQPGASERKPERQSRPVTRPKTHINMASTPISGAHKNVRNVE